MGLTKTLLTIPWRDIINNAPLIVEAAKKAYKTINKNPVPPKELPGRIPEDAQSLTELMEIVEELRLNEVRQAKLVSDLAEQVKALSEGIQAISVRLTLFMIIAVVSMLLSLFLVVKPLFFS